MSKKEKIMVPTNDYVFRRIFARKGSEKITEKFIECITNQKLKILKLDTSPILEKDLKYDKVGILDVYARGEKEDFDIEMQMTNMSNIKERILFYWSKMYLKNIKEGDNYKDLKKTVVILLANENVNSLIDLSKYHTKWQIREEKYTQKILTDKLEIHIIELGKINRYVNKKMMKDKNEKNLLLWLKFLTEPYKMGGEEMVTIKEISEAFEILNDLNSSEEERKRAEMRIDYVRNQHAAEDFGFDKGLEKGLIKGKEDEKIEIAINMIKMELDDQIIIKATGLNKKELNLIKEKQISKKLHI